MCKVLIRADMSDAGMVSIAPGVELRVDCVDVLTDIPDDPLGAGVVAIMYFEDQRSLDQFRAWYLDDDSVQVIDIGR